MENDKNRKDRPAQNGQGGNNPNGGNKPSGGKNPNGGNKPNGGSSNGGNPNGGNPNGGNPNGENPNGGNPNGGNPNGGNGSSRKNRRRGHRSHHNKKKIASPELNSPALNSSELEADLGYTAPDEEPDTLEYEGSVEDPVPEITFEITSEEDNTPKIHVTGVRYKPNGKVYYFDKKELELKTGNLVIVDTARGLELGEVAAADIEVKETAIVLPLREIVRVATDADVEHHKENKKREEEAFAICLEKIAKHGLDMKLIEVQYSFDNSKLLFYFTSASRVDFRELVKDLAGAFKTRIELRQIGIRDEAKLMGGLGACGRPLCCSTFLSDFVQVSIKMAKEQNLSLNSGKISGCCGRLMCCLQYEYKTYAEESAKTPPVDSVVKTREGQGTVTETNPLAGTLKVRLKDKPDTPPVLFKRDEVTLISRPSKKKDEE